MNHLYDWFATVDHKKIGVLYLLTALVFFAIGGIEALLKGEISVKPLQEYYDPFPPLTGKRAG